MSFYLNSLPALLAPSQVTGVALVKAARQGRPALRVSWTTPQSDVTISEYQVQFRRSGTIVWDSHVTVEGSPPATFTHLAGLDPGSEYDVRVRAKSAVGEGNWSEVQTERTFNSKFNCIIFISCMCTCMYSICSII